MPSRRYLVMALLALMPELAAAQTRECEIIPTDATRGTTYREQGMTFIGGGATFICPGDLRIRADSVAYIQAAGLVEFIGSVDYADSVKTLTADYAQYIGQAREVVARGNVVLQDRATGSTILAPYLNYWQASETRPESEVQIFSGRPRAILVQQAEGAAATDSTVIDSDAMQIIGERLFIGRGNVELRRGDMSGYGTEARLDQQGDSLLLAGNARVETEQYQLRGDSIRGLLTPDDRLREVIARWNARLESEDVVAEAPGLHVLLEDGEVQRLIALGSRKLAPGAPAAAPGGGAAVADQAQATSADFELQADSIDALAPGQALERMLAAGDAFGRRILPDSAPPRPEAAPEDWMRGDTIIATFGPAAVAAQDTAPSERVLENLIAVGAQALAQSLYAVPDEEDPDGAPAISYIVARRIEVGLVDGQVSAVRADSAVHGLYLQPADSARLGPPGVRRTAARGTS